MATSTSSSEREWHSLSARISEPDPKLFLMNNTFFNEQQQILQTSQHPTSQPRLLCSSSNGDQDTACPPDCIAYILTLGYVIEKSELIE